MVALDPQESNPLEGIKSILELVQTYGGTVVQLTDVTGICVQHLEDDDNIMCDLRELVGEHWVGLPGSPRYSGGEDQLEFFLGLLVRDFGKIENWYKPSAIETNEGTTQKLEQLKKLTIE